MGYRLNLARVSATSGRPFLFCRCLFSQVAALTNLYEEKAVVASAGRT